MLLTAEKLIDCNEKEFNKHFTGKKFPELPAYPAKIKWYGGTESLKMMLEYLAEKGFVITKDVKVYGFIIKGMSVTNMLKEHFKVSEPRKVSKKSFTEKLGSLFPETSGLRCKTRLYYKERNKQSISKVLIGCGITPFVIPE